MHMTNRVLAEMNVFFHITVDCSEILCVVFKPKEFDFASRFFIYALDQELSSREHWCRNFLPELE